LCRTQKQCNHRAIERSTHRCCRPCADGKTSTSLKYVICKRSCSFRPVLSHHSAKLYTFLKEFYDSINLKTTTFNSLSKAIVRECWILDNWLPRI
jgi:hypothetical protein